MRSKIKNFRNFSINLFQENQRLVRLLLLALVFVLLALYIYLNADQLSRLKDVKFYQIILIVIGQLLVLTSNALVLIHIIKLSNKKANIIESTQITAYSAIVNFFGFLQGGVGVRALYLKIKVGINIKRYLFLTAIQYLILFLLSALFIFVGYVFIINVSFLFIFGITIFSAVALFIITREQSKIKQLLHIPKGITDIGRAGIFGFLTISLLQIIGSFIAYSTELVAIGADFSFGALMMFTGISQFSIVLALTPGAIGIREGLLLSISSQMNLSLDEIVISALLDRSVFFITLCVVTPLALAARKKTISSVSLSDKQVSD